MAGGFPSPPRSPLTGSTQSGISGAQGSVPALSTDSTSFSSSSHPVDGQTDRGGSGLEPSPAALLLMNKPWVGRAAGRQITQVSKRPADSKAERWGIQFVEKPGQGWVEGGETGSCPPDVLPLGLTSIGNTQKRDSQICRASHRRKTSPFMANTPRQKSLKLILPRSLGSKYFTSFSTCGKEGGTGVRPPGCPRAGVRLARGEGLSPEPRGHRWSSPSPRPLSGVSAHPRLWGAHFILRWTDSMSEEKQIPSRSAQNPGLFGRSFRLQVISAKTGMGKMNALEPPAIKGTCPLGSGR